MLSKLLVNLWLVAYGRFRIRGTGALIRCLYPWLPGLRDYDLDVPGVGKVKLDFADGTAYAMLLRVRLGDLQTDVGFYKSIEKFLFPGAVFWDVGAFVGYLSAYFAHPRFKLAAIHAFEPNPANVAHLRALFKSGGVTSIHPFALGRTDQTLNLSMPARGGSSTSSLVRKCGGGGSVPVQVRRGDSVRKELELPMPDVIKIDVEGFEPEVIAGLSETIQKHRPVIFFEHIFLSDQQVQELAPAGYTLFFIGDDGRITDTLESRKRGHDAFMAPDEKKKAAEELKGSVG